MSETSGDQASGHLVVAIGKGRQIAAPARNFRVALVALLVIDDDGPDGVNLGVLSHEMLVAEFVRWNVPDAHASICRPRRRGGLLEWDSQARFGKSR